MDFDGQPSRELDGLFLNRSRSQGTFASSFASKTPTVEKAMELVPSLLPADGLNYADGMGPLLVATESDGSPGNNCFLSYRGELTKCDLEHVRLASSLEQLAAGAWEDAISEVLAEASDQLPPQPPVSDDGGLHPEEVRDSALSAGEEAPTMVPANRLGPT